MTESLPVALRDSIICTQLLITVLLTKNVLRGVRDSCCQSVGLEVSASSFATVLAHSDQVFLFGAPDFIMQ